MPLNRADQPDIDDDRAKSLRVQAEIARVKSQVITYISKSKKTKWDYNPSIISILNLTNVV